MLILIAYFREVYVVEFQKWGLPHAHILLTIATEDKFVCPKDVDRLISVEIPDQISDRLTYDVVTKFMVHEPCLSCLIDGKCLKLYPKRFCNQATFDKHGFALYRWRQNLKLMVVDGREINSQ